MFFYCWPKMMCKSQAVIYHHLYLLQRAPTTTVINMTFLRTSPFTSHERDFAPDFWEGICLNIYSHFICGFWHDPEMTYRAEEKEGTFVTDNRLTDEGTPRGPCGPKNNRLLAYDIYKFWNRRIDVINWSYWKLVLQQGWNTPKYSF